MAAEELAPDVLEDVGELNDQHQEEQELGAARRVSSRRLRDRALDTWSGKEEGSLAERIGGFRGRLLGADLDALADASGCAR